MRLRHKLLLSFLLLGVLPLLALGTWDYRHSIRALDALVSGQTSQIATRAALEIGDRLDLRASDIALLGGNEPTVRFLRALDRGDTAAARAARREVETFWREAWSGMAPAYDGVALLDRGGSVQVQLRDDGSAGAAEITRHPIHDPETEAVLGELQVGSRVADLLQSGALATRFGERGWNAVVDRRDGRIVRSPPDRSPPPESIPVARMADSSGTLILPTRAARMVLSWSGLPGTTWTVVAAAATDEFAGPFVRQRVLDLTLLVGVVVFMALAFTLLVHRATRSLDALTRAADRVGSGDLTPELPPAGPDEVGHLARAFRTMTTRLREMIAQVEASRQTAVLGRFAAELSHEIRNPLTAIKISLQGLDRDAREGRIPESSRESVRMALREIRRLDDAVRAALQAGRPPAAPQPFGIHDLLDDAVSLLRPQAAAGGIVIERGTATRAEGLGDREALRGALVNILLNAIEALPRGGTVRVSTTITGEDVIEIRVADDGPGIPSAIRDRVFTPFFTTKDGGTGLGLSLALQAVRAHGGSLTLAEVSRGTEVIVSLRIRPALVPA